MIVGVTLFALSGSAYYSLPFSRRGDAGLFSIYVQQVSENPTMTVDVEHKNVEDTAWLTAGSFSAITTTGMATKDVSALKEQVRYKITITATSPTAAVHFYIDRPSWRPTA